MISKRASAVCPAVLRDARQRRIRGKPTVDACYLSLWLNFSRWPSERPTTPVTLEMSKPPPSMRLLFKYSTSWLSETVRSLSASSHAPDPPPLCRQAHAETRQPLPLPSPPSNAAKRCIVRELTQILPRVFRNLYIEPLEPTRAREPLPSPPHLARVNCGRGRLWVSHRAAWCALAGVVSAVWRSAIPAPLEEKSLGVCAGRAEEENMSHCLCWPPMSTRFVDVWNSHRGKSE